METTPPNPHPRPDGLVPVDGHRDMFKTLDLLCIRSVSGPVYFVVEGCAEFEDAAELANSHEYFYEEHTCPTNFIRIPAIFTPDDDDPHGVFEFVATEWMTEAYVAADEAGTADEYLRRIFPQTRS